MEPNVWEAENQYVKSKLVGIKKGDFHEFLFFFDLFETECLQQSSSSFDLFYIFYECLLPLAKDAQQRSALMKRLSSNIFDRSACKAYCCHHRWASKCLAYLKKNTEDTSKTDICEHIRSLIPVLSLFSMTANELALLFSAITDEEEWSRPHRGFFLELLYQLVTPKIGPSTMFDFNARNSAIKIQLSPKRIPAKGFSFFAWLRIESFEDPNQLSDYQPRLFLFPSDNGNIETFFKNGKLNLVSTVKSKSDTYVFDFTFEPKKWYLICLSQEHNLLKKSQLSLFVNGQSVQSYSISLPKLESGDWIVGNNFDPSVPNPTSQRSQPFFGQLGTFALLQESLSTSEVESLHELGPNLAYKLNEDGGELISGTKGSVLYLEKKNVSKIIFWFTPTAVEKNSCFDICTKKQENNALMLGGVHKWKTKTFTEMLRSIGSLKKLLTLFTVPHDPTPLFELLTQLLNESPQLFEIEILESSAISVLGYLLERIPPGYYNQETVIKLGQLIMVALKTYGESSDIFLSFIKNILLNFSIWIYTRADVQQQVIKQMLIFVKDFPHHFRKFIGLESFIDILKYFYWPSVEGCSRRLLISEDSPSKRPNKEEITSLRRSLLQLASLLIEGNLQTEETLVIINYLRESLAQGIEQTDVLKAFSGSLSQYFEKTEKKSNSLENSAYYINLWENHTGKPSSGFVKALSIPFFIAYGRRTVEKQWTTIIRSLDRDEQNLRWKLDKTENSQRMRRRLKRKHDAVSYIGCAKTLTKPVIEEMKPILENIPKKGIKLAEGIFFSYSSLQAPEFSREGFLKKLGKFKIWKSRFVRLKNSMLEYRKPEKLKRKAISLEGVSIRKIEEKFNEYYFEIVTPKKTILFSTETRGDLEEWMRDIRSAIPKTNQSKENPEADDIDVDIDDNITLSNNTSEKLLYKSTCELILPLQSIRGVFELTDEYLFFFARNGRFNKWPIEQFREIYRRYYLLRSSALEIFLKDNTSIFLNFPINETVRALEKIVALKPPHLVNVASFQSSPEKLIKKAQKQWIEREISNFEYLMALNTIAGRTYNDLNQYPVFPWVIADYTSEILDLDSPASYRDLSRPIGALDEKNREACIARYDAFFDEKIPKFHYGTHYSNCGGVINFLMRLEPYTSYSSQLGGGKFDYPERMFTSIAKTWEGCTVSNGTNVRELIPEFFYMPEFLQNMNEVYFGRITRNQPVGDVELPPWAKSPEEFIRLNRAALESDYVSAHLHEWIDLIFGYKQRGEEAIKAVNCFFYLTYPGAVDLDSITDPVEKKSVESQILNFGQCPNQLFTTPHPKRKDRSQLPRRSDAFYYPKKIRESILSTISSSLLRQTSDNETNIQLPWMSEEGYNSAEERNSTDTPASPITTRTSSISDPDSTENLTVTYTGPIITADTKPISTKGTKNRRPTITGSNTNPIKRIQFHTISSIPIISICCALDSVVVIFKDGTVFANTFIVSQDDYTQSYTFEVDKGLKKGKSLLQSPNQGKHLDLSISPDEVTTPSNCFCLSSPFKFLFSCGNHDNSFRVSIYNNTTLKTWKKFVNQHSDTISCIAVDRDILLTASNNGLLKIWDLKPLLDKKEIRLEHELYGHKDKITCVDINKDEDLVVSGSKDQTCIYYTLRNGKYLRTIRFESVPEIVKISQEYIVTFCSSNQLFVHTVNGRLIRSIKTEKKIYDFKLSSDGGYIICGGDEVTIYETTSLKILTSFEMSCKVRAIGQSNDEYYIFAGLENSEFFILPFEKKEASYSSRRPSISGH